MMLPTLLESVLTRAEADGEAHIDGKWLDKVRSIRWCLLCNIGEDLTAGNVWSF